MPSADATAAPVMAEVPAQPVESSVEPAVAVDEPDLAAAAELAEFSELADPVDVPGLVDAGEPALVPASDGEPSSNGKRSLGFFSN
jgi:hypothetical protein